MLHNTRLKRQVLKLDVPASNWIKCWAPTGCHIYIDYRVTLLC